MAYTTRLSWGRNATQAVAVDGRPGIGKYEDHKRQAPRRKDKLYGQHQVSPQRVPKSRNSVELHLESRKCADFEFMMADWADSIPPPQYSQIPAPTTRDAPKSAVSNNLHRNQSSTPTLPPAIVPDVSLASEFSPALQSFLSPKPGQTTMPGRRRKESCSSVSTIFERSPTVPISIVVTTPDEEVPANFDPSNGSYFPSASEIRKFRNDSTMSLPSLSSRSLSIPRPIPDRSRLMPPLDPQVDARKLRKSREFEEIRHFLIGFLNSKGDQFPKKLRLRIMSTYGIRDGDLDPRTVAKFSLDNGEVQDEGIVLEHGLLPGEAGDKDHLRILEMAFQSVIPIVTPQPHPAHEILAARRKRMSMPFQSPSLHTMDELSPIAKRMSLSSHSKSKTTLDNIISNHSAAKNKRASAPPLKRSSTTASLPSKLNPKYQQFVIPPHHLIIPPPPKSHSTQRPSSRSSVMTAPPAMKGYSKSQSFPIQSHHKTLAPALPKPTKQFYAKAVIPTPLNSHQKPQPAVVHTELKSPSVTQPKSQPLLTPSKPLPKSRSLLAETQPKLPRSAPPISQPPSSTSKNHPKSTPLIFDTQPKLSSPSQPKSEPLIVNNTHLKLSPLLPAKSRPLIESELKPSYSLHQKSQPLIPSTKPKSTQHPQAYQPTRSPPPPTKDNDDYLPPSWMAPLISISPNDASTYINTTSTQRPAPFDVQEAEIMFPTHPAVSPLSGRNWLKLDEKQLQIVKEERGKAKEKKGSFMGMVRNAFGGSKKEKKSSRS